MDKIVWYVAKPQGVDSVLVYCHPDNDGKISLYRTAAIADKVAEEIGPDWHAELLLIG